MLRRKGSQFELYPHKVRYIQHGKETEQWALPDKQWWLDFEQKWEHTEIIEFTEVSLTEEQLERFEEVKHLDEAYAYLAEQYILTGLFPDELCLEEYEHLSEAERKNHPLQLLQRRKEGEALFTENAQLWYETMVLEGRLDEETALLWYELMTVGGAS